MADVQPTVSPAVDGEYQVMKFEWDLTTAADTGAPIDAKYCDFADRTVYFLGTNWGGATAVWEGGDGTTYLGLTDPQGTAISKTSDGIEAVTEVPEYSRPRLSVGGAAAVITAVCIARRGFKRA